ncbi:MAG: tRNA 2-thiouridine(34) synthase MnmA [bacterium]|nr:tRNA 2-thiouridine(34) synthase MnmA [bacterium]
MKIAIGMSGGLDSSTAAALLKEAGHDVIGVTLDVWRGGCATSREDSCCGEKGIEAARSAARAVGIRHRVVDARAEFIRKVVGPFCEEYGRGRTPNPCVRCNAAVKFPALAACADEEGAERIATGHYARVREEGGRFLLLRGADRRKDQAYFLSRLGQDILRRALFPLGDRTREETGRTAERLGIAAFARPESQEICFIPGDDYRPFLREMGGADEPGDILDVEGRVIGRHPGIRFFTVGQRRGLNVESNERLYVVAIDPGRRAVIVGREDALAREGCVVTGLNWIAFDPPPGGFRALTRIRYNHAGVMSAVRPAAGGTAAVRFDDPQKAVAPGQAAVFYDGETVLGSGWIEAAH